MGQEQGEGNSRGQRGSLPQTRRGLTLLQSQPCGARSHPPEQPKGLCPERRAAEGKFRIGGRSGLQIGACLEVPSGGMLRRLVVGDTGPGPQGMEIWPLAGRKALQVRRGPRPEPATVWTTTPSLAVSAPSCCAFI